MPNLLSAGELASRTFRHAEAVCWHFLKAGSKEGRYWLVGDTSGAPGVHYLFVSSALSLARAPPVIGRMSLPMNMVTFST